MLVGNASSGILEALFFRIPVINIVNRQRGRPEADNILNVGYVQEEISAMTTFALNNPEYQRKVSGAVNPYGDGKSSLRSCNILSEVNLDQALIDKGCTY